MVIWVIINAHCDALINAPGELPYRKTCCIVGETHGS